MIDSYFLLDNNVVSHLSQAQLDSAFLETQCRIPSEVLHEAGDRAELRKIEYPTSVAMLEALKEVMQTVDPSDTSLINLYANNGNADPLIVACALAEIRQSADVLIAPSWIVVSNDLAVRDKSKLLGVSALGRDDFSRRPRACGTDYSLPLTCNFHTVYKSLS